MTSMACVRFGSAIFEHSTRLPSLRCYVLVAMIPPSRMWVFDRSCVLGLNVWLT